MTGIEIAAWLITHSGDNPVTVMAPDYAKDIPVEVIRIELRSGAYIPRDALVGCEPHTVLVAGSDRE